MRKTIKVGDQVDVPGHWQAEVESIVGGYYYFAGIDEAFTASDICLVPPLPKEIKRTPLKKPVIQQSAPREKLIVEKLNKIRQVSKKQEKLNREYRKKAEAYLEKNTQCPVHTKNCTEEATQVHHKKGRSGNLLLNEEYWLPICDSCHIWITEHSREAIELGFSVRRNA